MNFENLTANDIQRLTDAWEIIRRDAEILRSCVDAARRFESEGLITSAQAAAIVAEYTPRINQDAERVRALDAVLYPYTRTEVSRRLHPETRPVSPSTISAALEALRFASKIF